MSTQPNVTRLWELEWTFGDRVRKARRVLGLTAAEMGDALGMTAQGVSNLEGRPGTPRAAFDIAGRIEALYEIPAWWLLGHEKPPAGPGAGLYTARDSNPEPAD